MTTNSNTTSLIHLIQSVVIRYWNNVSLFTPLPQLHKWKSTPPGWCIKNNQRRVAFLWDHICQFSSLWWWFICLSDKHFNIKCIYWYILSSKRFDGPLLWNFLLLLFMLEKLLYSKSLFVVIFIFLLVYFISRYTHFKYLVIVNFIFLSKMYVINI